jgi:hypothetical protein
VDRGEDAVLDLLRVPPVLDCLHHEREGGGTEPAGLVELDPELAFDVVDLATDHRGLLAERGRVGDLEDVGVSDRLGGVLVVGGGPEGGLELGRGPRFAFAVLAVDVVDVDLEDPGLLEEFDRLGVLGLDDPEDLHDRDAGHY